MDPDIGRGLFIACVVIATVAIYTFMVWGAVVRRTWWLSAIGVANTIALLTWAWMIQGAIPRLDMAALSHGSYAAIFGDLLFVTPAIIIATLGWRMAEDKIAPHWKHRLWPTFTLVCGFVFGIFMHIQGGVADSQSNDLGERLHDSATSWTHNLGVTPIFAATLACGIIPLLATKQSRWRHGTLAMLFVTGWFILSIIDGQRAGLDPTSMWYFNPHWLDAEMDWSLWRPA